MALSAADQERAIRALKRNIIKRDNAVSQFSIIADLGSKVEADVSTIPIFHARSLDLTDLLSNFHSEQDAILDQLIMLGRESEFSKSHAPIETRILEQYYLIKAVVAKLNLDTSVIDNSMNTSRLRNNVQLPKIQLPTFDGNLLKWCSYRDTFTSLIHDNTLLSDTEKFHYLISTVSGTAAPIVKAVPLTDANYTIAWDALQEMYNNKRVLITNYLDIIFHYPAMATETLTGLTEFLSAFRENIAAIRALEVNDLAGFLLFYIASRVLSPTTKRLFEAEYHTNDMPDIDLLLKFTHARCQILQNSVSGHVSITRPILPKPSRNKATSLAITTESKSCKHCKGSHFLHQCMQFSQLPVNQRFKIAREQGLCRNCLSPLHKTGECSSIHSCRQCSGKHHTLLHFTKGAPKALSTKGNRSPTALATTTPLTMTNEETFVGVVSSPGNVILGTATLRIQDSSGQWVIIRALVDTGSQISVITSAVVTRLGLKRHNSYTSVTGLAQTKVPATKGSTRCILTSLYSDQLNLKCEPMILTKIIDLMPSFRLSPTVRQAYSDIVLADPQFDAPAPIDFLLGADLYPLLLGECSRVLHKTGLPSAYETTVGWIILGRYSGNVSTSCKSLLLTTEPSISHLIRKFWEIEEPSPPTSGFSEEQKCEEHFERTTTRDSTGRFSVSLPFRGDPARLGDSRSIAISRFYNLERKLQREPLIYEEYRKFMAEYEQLGHMSLAPSHGNYYIPHHAVVKGVGTQVKLRVVFDASAASTSGKSLNEILHVGPKLQVDISQLLHRCRFRKYMFTADICKMYRQIQVHREDRKYQRIVWRPNPSEELKEFELNTVTYGVASSPFQAIRTLHQLEKEDGHRYPYAKNILTTETYVDDIISGHNNLPDLLRLRSELIMLLSQAGLILKKWASNCIELMKLIPAEDQAPTVAFDSKEDVSLKILGLHWDPYQDSFTYYASNVVDSWTKRSVLSTIAKLYDPLGVLAPITFMAKCFMQTVWQSGIQWDDKLPTSMLVNWQQFVLELPLVCQIKVPRHISTSNLTSAQLLGFSDASEKGYAAVIYLRMLYEDGRIAVTLITAKSKVAPLKTGKCDTSLTIPRLELCGALLLSQTLHHMSLTFHDVIPIESIQAWTDSRVVLSWLTSPQENFKIFVTNRLAKIANLTPSCQWHYIRSAWNPADCVSRGLLPSQLLANMLYWQGPPFLQQPITKWPDSSFEPWPTTELPDVKTKGVPLLCAVATAKEKPEWFSRFSSLTRLQRVIAFVLRFSRYTRRIRTENGPLSRDELDQALVPIIRSTQQWYFSDLLRTLQSKDSKVSPRSIAQLAPFLDEEGIIRVGGRIRNAIVPTNTQCPILLPKSSTVTSLLIRHFHLTYLHAGSQLTSSLIRRKYWILASRSAIRQVVLKCVVCARYRATAPQPQMADLPPQRVCASRPFSHVGIDFAGPFLIKDGSRRNARSIKCYLAVFVCMAVKAAHIEVVSDLSTDAFIASLHRFVSRRGIPINIYSDCGTNFKGADRQLQLLFTDSSTRTAFIHAAPCKWNFNPPAAPHFGGLWEATVKSTKYHIRRVIGTQLLTFEEMTTLASRIEAILNSRPLTALSSDPNDLHSLSPGDFLIGQPLVAIPEPDVMSTASNRLTRWQLLRQMHQSFWKRWSNEYLTSLQNRGKWLNHQPNVNSGDLVVVQTPNQPPTHWKLGRIEKTHPGEDGTVRVVTVRTVDGTIMRPVVKLAMLPIDQPRPDL